jgi:hypothetical protein
MLLDPECRIQLACALTTPVTDGSVHEGRFPSLTRRLPGHRFQNKLPETRRKKSNFNLVAKLQYAIFPGYFPAANWASLCALHQCSLICLVGATLEVIATISRNQQLGFRLHITASFGHSS